MSYTFNDFTKDCWENGQEWAAAITPPIAWPVTVPVVGIILATTIMPVLHGGAIALEKLAEQKQLLKRLKVSEAEKSIRATFGNIATKGYIYYGGGIEMSFTEAEICYVEKDKMRQWGRTPDTHFDREQCAKDLLGELAYRAKENMRDGEEKYIVVKKKGDLTSKFYQAAKIENKSDAPKNAVIAAQHYYNSAIGHGGVRCENLYAITPVNKSTEKRLLKLEAAMQ